MQRSLCSLSDEVRLAKLGEEFHAAGNDADIRRIRELRSPDTDHSWMWLVNPVHGLVLPAEKISIAMRLRVCAPILVDDVVCQVCQARVLDKKCTHSLCCSLAEATIGHNRVKEVVHAFCAVSDSSACMEAAGLVDSQPDLRPADILTRAAIPNRLAALDVGLKCSEASGAGHGCAQAMVEEKLEYYASVLPELERKGITYAPITFSSFGRRHGTTTKIMIEAAFRAAQFRGHPNQC